MFVPSTACANRAENACGRSLYESVNIFLPAVAVAVGSVAVSATTSLFQTACRGWTKVRHARNDVIQPRLTLTSTYGGGENETECSWFSLTNFYNHWCRDEVGYVYDRSKMTT